MYLRNILMGVTQFDKRLQFICNDFFRNNEQGYGVKQITEITRSVLVPDRLHNGRDPAEASARLGALYRLAITGACRYMW